VDVKETIQAETGPAAAAMQQEVDQSLTKVAAEASKIKTETL
jgi:hypothetical protein